ncbi:uncharacterized protein LOC124545586 [Schistocerca americana]|uniref:uncharacterized protein LOC124545586 n=1 Tax=Schistocerca americana TaxID=7009 RepID=UPI001F4F272E|nr:uncharacterized protein LOC124545586 [Schistocerca americana]
MRRMGDVNSRIVEGRSEELVVPYGLGIRNDRGERLCQFCQEEKMKITNTWFELPPGRLCIWRAPADRPDDIVQSQIDYILINKRFGSSLTRACTYLEAHVPSDHVLLVAEIKIKIKNVKKHAQRKIEYDRIKNEDIKNRTGGGLKDPRCVPLVHSYSRDELEAVLNLIQGSCGGKYPVEEEENPWDGDWPGLPEYYCGGFEQPPPQEGAEDIVPRERRLLELLPEEEEQEEDAEKGKESDEVRHGSGLVRWQAPQNLAISESDTEEEIDDVTCGSGVVRWLLKFFCVRLS